MMNSPLVEAAWEPARPSPRAARLETRGELTGQHRHIRGHDDDRRPFGIGAPPFPIEYHVELTADDLAVDGQVPHLPEIGEDQDPQGELSSSEAPARATTCRFRRRSRRTSCRFPPPPNPARRARGRGL